MMKGGLGCSRLRVQVGRPRGSIGLQEMKGLCAEILYVEEV